MFGHNLPRRGHPCDRRCALASFSYNACAHVPYNYFNLHVRGTPNCPHSRYFAYLPNFCPKIVKNYSADFQQVTKKMHFFLHFFSKIFGQFKKKQYFCIRFRPKFGVAPKDESNDL